MVMFMCFRVSRENAGNGDTNEDMDFKYGQLPDAIDLDGTDDIQPIIG